MFIVKDITIPANTSEPNAVLELITPPPGVIHRVEIYFPPGHAGLTRVQIYWFESQIYPSIHGDSFRGDNINIAFDDFFRVLGLKDELMIKAWNLDEIFSHTVTVRIGILPEIIVLPTKAFAEIDKKLTLLLRRIGIIV